MHLESRHLAPGTINLRLGAVRRLAYEAADYGLLSPDLAAGIRRVKGVKKIGVRLGNWLTPEQSQRLWNLDLNHSNLGGRVACEDSKYSSSASFRFSRASSSLSP